MSEVNVGGIRIGKGNPLVLISGPCVLESEAVTMEIADRLRELCHSLDIPLIFKASYEKDNRGSEKSYKGPGLEEGLRLLSKVKERTPPCLTSVLCLARVLLPLIADSGLRVNAKRARNRVISAAESG